MTRHGLVPAALVLLVWGCVNAPLAAQKTQAGAGLQGILKLLQESIDMKDFQAPMSLKEALGMIQDKLNARYKGEDVLPILVNTAAFTEELGDNPEQVYETPVRFPPFPRHLTIADALKLTLSKVTPRATFIVRDRFIEVTTAKAGSLKNLLRQKVFGALNRRPLAEAIEELSAPNGVSVLLDPRLGDRLKMPVTAVLINDTPLEGALRLLTDMVGLKLYVSDDGVYVTSPENAETLQKEDRARQEEAARRKQQANPNPAPQPVPGAQPQTRPEAGSAPAPGGTAKSPAPAGKK
jgi:hypothetical protein